MIQTTNTDFDQPRKKAYLLGGLFLRLQTVYNDAPNEYRWVRLAFGLRQQTTTSVTQTETIAKVEVAEELAIEPEANAGAMPSTTEVSRPSQPRTQNPSLF